MSADVFHDGFRRARKWLVVLSSSVVALVLAALAWLDWVTFLHPGTDRTEDLIWGLGGLPDHPFPRAMVFAAGALACSAFAAGRALRRETPWRAPRSTLELMQEARGRAFPFYICVRCRLLIAYESCAGPCPQCRWKVDCLEILDSAELDLAEAALDVAAS
jgi:hypothetical protein